MMMMIIPQYLCEGYKIISLKNLFHHSLQKKKKIRGARCPVCPLVKAVKTYGESEPVQTRHTAKCYTQSTHGTVAAQDALV